ncbi:MAG TPA: ABC transporter ATP-binding protein [bacterium]|nr:ABC transporter ATP-binding protein [bacterium]HOL47741.1 ABC transporter ATP-binding protein [bacterium]HPQ18025.1 ABC transporter ATP-binding protein [bacterium]
MKKNQAIVLYFYFLKYLLKHKLLIIFLIISIIGYSLFNGISISLIKPLIDEVFIKSQINSDGLKIEKEIIKINEKKIIFLPKFIKKKIFQQIPKINNFLYRKINGLSFKKLIKILASFILITIFLKLIFLYAKNFLSQYIGNKIVIEIRDDLYKKILSMPMQFFDKSKTGDLLSVLINDTQVLYSSIIVSFFDVIFYFFEILFLLFIVFYINYKLAFFSIILVVILLLPILKLNKRLKERGYILQQCWADILSIFQEALAGIFVIKSFGMENYELDKAKAVNKRLFKHTLKTFKYIILASPITEFAGTIVALIILIFGTNQIIKKNISPGDFILFLTALLSTMSPLKRFIDAGAQVYKSFGAAFRVINILKLKSKITESKTAIELKRFNDKIEFKNVYFSYDNDNYVIKDFNLTINKGEVCAIVGRSGSGKTTIINLIPRFYDVNKGEILIDSVNIKNIKFESLFNLIAIVSQDTFLFNETIKYNISYGLKTVSEEDIINAAKIANAHNFIMEFPDGYDTIVGEKGVLLSGGQRQRIAIARAILKNPPILLLDEATSALDTESEIYVQQAIEKLMSNRTTIVIAHRLSTIVRADKIVVIDDGQIKEIGTHNQLIEKNGLYKKLYDLQFNI